MGPIQFHALPSHGETCAVVEDTEKKRTALLFDRIYLWPNENGDYVWSEEYDLPQEIAFGAPRLHAEADEKFKQWVSENAVLRPGSPQWKAGVFIPPPWEDFVSANCRCIQEIYSAHGIPTTTIYPSETSFSRGYPEGHSIAYQAALNNLPVVLERDLTWEEVLAFREDKDAVRRYRALRLWLSSSLSAKSVDEATDLIAKKLDDYEWAIRKHGLKTVTGGLSSILDWKFLAGLAGGGSLGTLLAGPIGTAIGAGLILASKVAVWVAERKIEGEDVRRGTNSEIAIIYDARQLAAK